MTVGVLVLAAGQSTRFGADKRRATLADGGQVLQRLLATLTATGLDTLVCLGPGDAELQQQFRGEDLSSILCERAPMGMGETLAEGMGHCDHWSGVLVALGDMPWILPDTFRSVAAALTPGCIVTPMYDGRAGHPVGFGQTYFSELKALTGDRGARSTIDAHPEARLSLDVNDPSIHRDIDTPTDLDRRAD